MPERLMALKRMPYGRRIYDKGEYFLADHIDARTLVLTGCCAPAPEDPALPTAEPEVTPIDFLPLKRKPGRPRKHPREYERRDMLPKK